MKQKYTLILDDEFTDYCELNNIDDVDKLAKDTFKRGYTILKYGETPSHIKGKDRIIEKEVIKEVIVEKVVEVKIPYEVEKIKEVIKEIPVEVIKEVIKEVKVEVIKEVPKEIIKEGKTKTKTVVKEVPVEVIKEVIKEVPVEKIVEIIKEVDNTAEIERLTKENESLKRELDLIQTSLSKFNRGKFMKNSDLSNLYDE